MSNETTASWQAGDVEANGIRLHYTRTGGNKPPLVLAHGVTDDGLCWTPLASALEAEYDVVMVDARGHGRSDAPEQGYDPATQAADLHGVIAALGLQKPIVLGHSMGAVTTLVLAGLHPDVPRAILLEDPPAWWVAPPEWVQADKDDEAETRLGSVIHGRDPDDEQPIGMHAWLLSLKSKTRAELIAEQRAATPGWSEAELEPWAESKLRVSLNVGSLFTSNPAASVDWPATLGSIICPALLITADPSRGAIVTEKDARALQMFVPQLQIMHIPEAGHNIRRDQFDRYMEVVRAFLAEHTPAAQ